MPESNFAASSPEADEEELTCAFTFSCTATPDAKEPEVPEPEGAARILREAQQQNSPCYYYHQINHGRDEDLVLIALSHFEERLKYAIDTNEWYVFDNMRWRADQGAYSPLCLVRKIVRMVCQGLRLEAKYGH